MKAKKKKLKLPSAPFRLSEEDIRKADSRARNVSVPSGYGWRPKPFFAKRTYIISCDWKHINDLLHSNVVIFSSFTT